MRPMYKVSWLMQQRYGRGRKYWRRYCSLTRMDKITNEETRRRMKVETNVIEYIARPRKKREKHMERKP